MRTQELDPRLDPSRLDPSRGLERDGDDWTMFGLSLDPDAWVALDPEARGAVDRLWIGPAKWSQEDPGVLHGLVVGARTDVRALITRGAPVRGVRWADLGGSTGHYAIALALEGARHVLLVDEGDPGSTARRVLDALRIEVVVGNAYEAPLLGIEAVLALYSVDPMAVLHRGIDVVVHAPAGDHEHDARVDTLGFAVREVSWTSELQMGDGCCRLGAAVPASADLWERRPARDDGEKRGEIRHLGHAVYSVLERLHVRGDGHLPAVPRSSVQGLATGSRPIDVALGGLRRGGVHLVVSSDPEARTAVLLDLVTGWPHLHDSPVLLAGPGSELDLARSLVASVTGLARSALVSGALSTQDYMTLFAAASELSLRIDASVRRAHDLDPEMVGAVGAIAVDLDELREGDLEHWRQVAHRLCVPIVLGVDSSSPMLGGHTFPELRLTRLAFARGRARLACQGVRVDGELSRRIVVDVEHASLRLRAYDPANEYIDGEAPVDDELVEWPEDGWVTGMESRGES